MSSCKPSETFSDAIASVLRGQLFITVGELAQVLRMDERTIRRGVQRGDIPAVRIGTTTRISASTVYAMCLPDEDTGGGDRP